MDRRKNTIIRIPSFMSFHGPTRRSEHIFWPENSLRRFLKIILTVLLAALPALMSRAQLIYATDNSEISVIGYDCSAGSVVIPDFIDGLPVTSIGDGTFQACVTLTNIILSTNLTSIGQVVFTGCANLTSITIPDGVTNIGIEAFQLCLGLTNITIPASVTTIGEEAFLNCINMTAINVAPGNPAYSSIEGVLFDSSQTTLIQYPIGNKAGSYAIPDGVMNVGELAFFDCTNLTNVTIPDGLSSIGGMAFYANVNLPSISFPESLINIGVESLDYCSRMTEIDVDTNNPWFSSLDGVLFDSNQSTLIKYPSGKGGASYVIPDGVTSIQYYAFVPSPMLTNIMIPEGVINIGEDSFSECTALLSIVVPDSVSTIGVFAFSGCGNLGSLTIGTNVTTIGLGAFYGCGKLPNAVIPNGVTSIQDATFVGCASLTNVTLPDGLTKLGNSAFDGCNRLANIPLPESLTTLEISTLRGTGLTSITIPKNVADIGQNAFESCTQLKAVFFQGNPPNPNNDSSVFSGDSDNPIAYYLPGSTGWGPTFDGIPTAPLLNIQLTGSGTNAIATFMGLPNFPFTLQRSTNLTQGAGWISISTNVARADGKIFVIDNFQDLGVPIQPAPSPAFYRAAYYPGK
jgi:hypothetical protein